LVSKDIVEQCLLVRVIVPLDGLIQHHDEEPIDRLREEQLAKTVWREGHGPLLTMRCSTA